MENSSLPLLHFKDPESALNFVCAICTKVPHPSTAIEHVACGRIFCRPCLNAWFRSHTVCPQCGQPAAGRVRDIVSENKMVFHFVSNLHLYCPSTLGSDGSRACHWMGPWSALADHLRTCEELAILCKFGCGYAAARKYMQFHESSVCTLRPVICDFCAERFPHKDLNEHMLQCKKNVNEIHPCRYINIGCVFIGNRSERARHEAREDKLHLELALAHIKKLETLENRKKVDQLRRHTPMTLEEKLALKRKLSQLQNKDVDGLMQIIKDSASVGAAKDLVEFNLETLPTKTCRRLERYVDQKLFDAGKKRSSPEDSPTFRESPSAKIALVLCFLIIFAVG